MVPHPEPISGADYSAVELTPDDSCVLMLDQRGLPEREEYVRLSTADEVASAIADMVVRGAPAIGISGAYGMVLAARGPAAGARERLRSAAQVLIDARPTAVNLAWAIGRQLAAVASAETGADLVQRLADEARAIHREDVAACRNIGQRALAHIPAQAMILTHCNAGALATGGYGTALGVIRAAHEAGKNVRVLADETRPYLQGARLTAWELQRAGIQVEVISDSSAAHQMAHGRVDCVVVGADRIAANGDVANKIGTYGLACIARAHDCPLYVAAPWSTVDLECASGGFIPIEQRSGEELTQFNGRRIVPVGVAVNNPSFDVTPAAFVRALFTERGIASPLTAGSLFELAAAATGSAVVRGHVEARTAAWE